MVIRSFNQTTTSSSAECSCRRPPSSASLVSCQDSTMWFLICGWSHVHLNKDAICCLCELSAQWSCPVWNWFIMDLNWWRRSKPGGRIAGCDINIWLTASHLWVIEFLKKLGTISSSSSNNLVNKMLSYRRETALHGALQFSPKVEDWNWETIFYGHYRSIFNHCDVIGLKICRIPWKNAK